MGIRDKQRGAQSSSSQDGQVDGYRVLCVKRRKKNSA